MPIKDPEKRKAYTKAYHKMWYDENKISRRQQIADRKEQIREWFRSFKMNLACSNCNESHISCLDFHHVDGSKKEKGVSEAVLHGWSILRIEEEISKCIILCANCHRKHHYEEENSL